ncbi:amino acid permease-associated region [Aspergillus oryzae]|uniref:Amino acid permease-associated region n=1 Tax=Aspergillus oryzae TaxID=5062 RepID=A0A1S9DG62_ASPOZ|nr:amino acid permease-associated region [Aspergillus oryzae]
MVGGNPQHDAFGFRAWRDPGPMAEYLHTGDLGRFEGVLAALWTASFTIMGPEFINLIAAEAKRPRVHIKNAFKVIYWLPSVNRITAGAIIDYIVVCVTYIFFYRACQAQSVDRKTFT